MANNCFFEVHVQGNEDGARFFADALIGMGRIYTADAEEVLGADGDLDYVEIYGDCAWSLQTALGVEYEPNSEFNKEIERLGLSVEAYSLEPGIGFQEHYVYKEGRLDIADYADYTEIYYGDMDPEQLEELAERLDVSPEAISAMSDPDMDDTIAIGGFRWDFAGTYGVAGPSLEELRDGVPREIGHQTMTWHGAQFSEFSQESDYKQSSNLQKIILGVEDGGVASPHAAITKNESEKSWDVVFLGLNIPENTPEISSFGSFDEAAEHVSNTMEIHGFDVDLVSLLDQFGGDFVTARDFSTNLRLKLVEQLWEELGDVCIDNEGHIDSDWRGYERGTHREEIWHDFEDDHLDIGVTVAGLMGFEPLPLVKSDPSAEQTLDAKRAEIRELDEQRDDSELRHDDRGDDMER